MAIKTILSDIRYPDFVSRYANNLNWFSIEVCGTIPTPQQYDLNNSVVPVGSRTTVSSGHGIGKSRLIAVAALWHLLCYHGSNTMLTAPKIEQVRNIAWKEINDIKNHVERTPHAWICQYFVIEAERVYVIGFKATWFIFAKTAPRGSSENLAGQHRDWYLLIADEASGIPDEHYKVLTGALTDKRNRMLLTSQPTRANGYFYDTHHSLSKQEGGAWNTFVMSSVESPRVSLEFILEKRLEYTEIEYTIKVLGQFPDKTDGNLLGRKDIEACFGRNVIRDTDRYGIIMAVDVGAGEYRDKSVAVVAFVCGYGDTGIDARRVQVVSIPIFSNTRNIQDLTGDVFNATATLENCTTLVDAGGMGVAVCQQLETLGLPNIHRIYWGKPCFKKSNRERFFNLRSQAVVCASRAAKEGRLGISNDIPCRRDILDQASRVPYHFDERARYKIESKEEMKKQGLPSPDVWDSIAFLFLEDAHYIIAEKSGNNSLASTAESLLSDLGELFSEFE